MTARAIDWTQERMDTVRTMRRAGKPASEISEAVGVSRSAVLGWCQRNGVELPGAPVIRVDDEVRQKLAAMTAEGLNYNEISARLGINAGTLRRTGATMGLTAGRRRQASDAAQVARLQRRDDDATAAPFEARSFAACFAEGYRGQTGRIAIHEQRDGLCHFPVDQAEGPLRYCGDETREGKRWCPHHEARCYAREAV